MIHIVDQIISVGIDNHWRINMQEWVKDFLNEHNDKNIFKLPPIPESLGNDLIKQFEWIANQSNTPWLEIIGVNPPYKEMVAEAQGLKDMFVYHRGLENGHNGWRSLAIHGIEATKTNVAEEYGLNSREVEYHWTEIQDRCPVTTEYFKNQFPYRRYQRLRFMLLEAGGFIAPHTDNAVSSLTSAINISLNNPTDCRLTTTVGTIPFKDQGSTFLFNNHYQHAVHNNSDTDRYHMIVHGEWKSPEWQQLVVNSYKRALNG